MANIYIRPNAIKPNSLSLDTLIGWDLLNLENITYSQLVTLRNQNQLIPGKQYRITDYVTTTVQEDTQSAGHPFDVIVVADSNNTLNENARAIKRDGDTYFINSNLAAWELKYCLDNDTTKFAWADESTTTSSEGFDYNGKGVIYYMKDEFNNECPYDFKNILFKRYKTTSTHEALVNEKSKIEGYLGWGTDVSSLPPYLEIMSDADYVWKYTFNTLSTEDDSLSNKICSNIIKPYFITNMARKLNNIVICCDVFISYNTFCVDNHDMTFISSGEFGYNYFGNQSYSNVFVCEDNYENLFEKTHDNVVVSCDFSNNDFGNFFKNNLVVGTMCSNRTSSVFVSNHIVSMDKLSTSRGVEGCDFGINCRYNNLSCLLNCKIGQMCYNNTIINITASQIGIGFRYNTFKTSNDLNSADRPYIQGCTFGNYIWFNNFYNSSTASSSNAIKNLRVQSYLQGASAENPNHIEVPVASVGEITVSKNSAGEIKVYNVADIVA